MTNERKSNSAKRGGGNKRIPVGKLGAILAGSGGSNRTGESAGGSPDTDQSVRGTDSESGGAGKSAGGNVVTIGDAIRADSGSTFGGGTGETGSQRGSGDGKRGSGNGDAPRTGTGNGNGKRTGSAQSDRAEVGADVPRSGVKPSGYKAKAKGQTKADQRIEEAAIIGLIAVGLNALYGTAGLLMKDDNWNLNQFEATTFSKQFHEALKTLPGNIYEEIIKNFERYAPWIGLIITAGAITVPRIRHTQAVREARKASGGRTPTNSGNGQGGAAANPFEYGGAFNNTGDSHIN